MGGAILDGWSNHPDMNAEVYIIDPHAQSAAGKNTTLLENIEELPESFQPDVIFLAVKPQIMDTVLPSYKKFENALYISIAAGKTLEYLENILGNGKSVIRAMPNLPAAVAAGATVFVANRNISAEQKRVAIELLVPVGLLRELEDESLMDAVTAVSGSGPAYVFYFIESLARAGEEAGLPTELAEELAFQTVWGTPLLANEEGNPNERVTIENLAKLRKNVTSPGGTTEAALKILMDEKSGLYPLLSKAITAAAKRSEELRE